MPAPTRAYWRDIEPGDPSASGWRGLDLTVTVPRRPGLSVTAATGRRLRLACGTQPLAWTRVYPDYSGTATMVARDNPRLLPPLGAALARSMPGAAGSDAWWSAWSRWLVRHLLVSPVSPLHAGHWRVAPYVAGARSGGFERVQAQEPVDESRWDFSEEAPPLALRPLQHAGQARVKAWRRSAREGHLPPLVLLWVSGLDRHVILDGHDRLVAGLAEGLAPPALSLEPQCFVPPARIAGGAHHVLEAMERHLAAATSADPRPRRPYRVETINKALLQAFDERPIPRARTRAWPVPGGTQAWDLEVAREHRDRGLAGQSPLLD